MDLETSPFSPGQTVPVGSFVGRTKQIEYLRGMVRTSATGRLKAGFVTGERGIGKRSLGSFISVLSETEDIAAGFHVHLG